MNDFTKDELKQIKFDMSMGLSRFDASFTGEMYLALEKKIQYMIDNYCDHEPDGDFHVCVDKCKKCGIICEDECKHKWMNCFYGENQIPIRLCVLCDLREKR